MDTTKVPPKLFYFSGYIKVIHISRVVTLVTLELGTYVSRIPFIKEVLFNKFQFYINWKKSMLNVHLFFEVIGDCRDGWTKFQGSCYLFASDQANWPEAQVIIMFDLSTPYLYKNTGFDKKKKSFV